MAHFDRYVPYFHHNLSKMSIPLKLGVPACSEVTLSKSSFSAIFLEKILVLTDFDQMKTPPSYTSLESCGSWRFNHIARNTDHSTCQPSEFRGRSWTDFLDDPTLCHKYIVKINLVVVQHYINIWVTCCLLSVKEVKWFRFTHVILGLGVLK